MILPEGTIQLTLHDQTAVHFPYKDPRWTEFVLFLYHSDSLPNLNRWDCVRYQIVRRALLKLYRDPVNFRKNAVAREERVIPVLAPPLMAVPAKQLLQTVDLHKCYFLIRVNLLYFITHCL